RTKLYHQSGLDVNSLPGTESSSVGASASLKRTLADEPPPLTVASGEVGLRRSVWKPRLATSGKSATFAAGPPVSTFHWIAAAFRPRARMISWVTRTLSVCQVSRTDAF